LFQKKTDEITHFSLGKSKDKHKYVARVVAGRKPNGTTAYRYFYTDEEYNAYLDEQISRIYDKRYAEVTEPYGTNVVSFAYNPKVNSVKEKQMSRLSDIGVHGSSMNGNTTTGYFNVHRKNQKDLEELKVKQAEERDAQRKFSNRAKNRAKIIKKSLSNKVRAIKNRTKVKGKKFINKIIISSKDLR